MVTDWIKVRVSHAGAEQLQDALAEAHTAHVAAGNQTNAQMRVVFYPHDMAYDAYFSPECGIFFSEQLAPHQPVAAPIPDESSIWYQVIWPD